MMNEKLIAAAYKELRRAYAIGDILGISLWRDGGIQLTREQLIERFGDGYQIEPFGDRYIAKISITNECGVKWFALCAEEELTEDDKRRLEEWQE